jgi:hypothetical protein
LFSRRELSQSVQLQNARLYIFLDIFHG